MIRFATGLSALALLAACSPANAPSADIVALHADASAVSAAALHGVLIAEADQIIPSVWDTGEPAPQTALDYWYVPPTLDDILTSTECQALPDMARAYDCTLILRAPNYDAEEDERRDVEALYRMQVLIHDDNSLTLASPNVRWAVRDAE